MNEMAALSQSALSRSAQSQSAQPSHRNYERQRSSFGPDGLLFSARLLRRANFPLGGAVAPAHQLATARTTVRSLLTPKFDPLRRLDFRHWRHHDWLHRCSNGSRLPHLFDPWALLVCRFLRANRRRVGPRRRDDQAGGNQQASVEFRRPEQSDTA